MSPGSRCVKHMEPGLFLCRAETFYAQHHYHAGTAPGGYTFTPPTAAVFPQKCGRWHFENAVGRENPVKARPVDSILCLHRARFRMTVSARFFRCLRKEKMRFERAGHQPLLSLPPTIFVNYTAVCRQSAWPNMNPI